MSVLLSWYKSALLQQYGSIDASQGSRRRFVGFTYTCSHVHVDVSSERLSMADRWTTGGERRRMGPEREREPHWRGSADVGQADMCRE